MTIAAQTIAGIELGGTKTVLILARDDEILEQSTIPTSSPGETIERARFQLIAWRDRTGFTALGIAAFGPLDLDSASPTFGRLFETPKPGWTNFDIAGELTRGLDCRWSIDTDVNGAALSERRWGAAMGCDNLCYITVGTGVGAGLVINGSPVHGTLHPELGHLRVRRARGDRFLGACHFHGDCIEGLVSGPALTRRFNEDPAVVSDDCEEWDFVAGDLAELVTAVLLANAVERVLLGGTVMLSRQFLVPKICSGVLDRLGTYLPGVDETSIGQIVRLPGLGKLAGPMGSIAIGLSGLTRLDH